MDPATILILASGAAQALKLLLPEIEKRVAAGEISAAEQQAVLDAVNALRDPNSGAYTGPEMAPSGR